MKFWSYIGSVISALLVEVASADPFLHAAATLTELRIGSESLAASGFTAEEAVVIEERLVASPAVAELAEARSAFWSVSQRGGLVMVATLGGVDHAIAKLPVDLRSVARDYVIARDAAVASIFEGFDVAKVSRHQQLISIAGTSVPPALALAAASLDDIAALERAIAKERHAFEHQYVVDSGSAAVLFAARANPVATSASATVVAYADSIAVHLDDTLPLLMAALSN